MRFAGSCRASADAAKIHGRTDRGDRFEFGWAIASPFAGKFQHEVAAHGKSDECELLDAVVLDHVARDGRDVGGQARVVESGRVVIHAAAVALVHEDDVHPGGETVASDAQHVLRFGRTFETVDGDYGQRLRAIGLPAAPAADFCPGSDFDQTLFRRREMNLTRHEETGDGLHVSAAKPASGAKRGSRLPSGLPERERWLLALEFVICELPTN